jgi:hypothetical protein
MLVLGLAACQPAPSPEPDQSIAAFTAGMAQQPGLIPIYADAKNGKVYLQVTGSNPEYLDCNYGGVLMVFDRLFGTYVEERADLPPRYGLTTPLLTNNPLRIAFHEWINLARDLRDARSALDICRALLLPPGARKNSATRETPS